MKTDKINPSHYTKLSPEPITVIEAWKLGYHLGNALKYIARAGNKEGESTLDDLQKARWYIDRAIEFFRAQELSTVEQVKGEKQ